ncbi:hypothetical protein IQ07DRAFT_380732 [Pyrenochaeta sp. DS3sAY3a]|nr:hypothetical protein IQ07DRAFT_380732 [Pyrenochaeta sp. DS3sAY3a]
MYSCNKCHRTYRTQNSLTRHAHSHRSDNKHQCVTCGVVFYRRDLLTRHSKLHQNPSNASVRSSASDDDFDAGFSRQRCHTACDRCRESKTKCNGRNPCNTCSGAAMTCHYSHRSSRLSRLPRQAEIRKPRKRQGQEGAVDLPYQQHPTPSPREVGPLDEENDQIDLGHPPQLSPDPQQNYGLHMDSSIPDLNIYDGPIPIDNSMTWPWLHEDLYLPADPSVFAMPLDSMNSQAFRSASYVNAAIDPFPIAASLPLDGLGVQSHGIANVDQAADPVMAGINAQNDASVHAGFEDATATSSTLSAGRNSYSEAANFHPPLATASTSRLEQSRIVQDLIAFAAAPTAGTKSNDVRASFWEAASDKIAFAFEISCREGDSTELVLYRFCNQYMEHFAPLWPLLSRHLLDYDALHPALFLVLTSIGAMYCGSQASGYGAMMHTQIRGMLTTAIELEDDDKDFVWLAQARLLTQVAALYFGQPKAFTYAHHLGALLVAQAQRNNLFSAIHASKTLQKFNELKGVASDEERFRLWLQLETRRRLAFGIFRGDTYTSCLLHTKPLVSMEEIDLCLPSCDAVWRGENLSASLCLQMIEHDQTPSRELWASDIFRIAMDSKERLPPLSPAGQELLMFGLQCPLWRFSKDREMFTRLTGGGIETFNRDASVAESEETTVPSVDKSVQSTKQDSQAGVSIFTESEAHHLESSVKRMEDLRHERERLLAALAKWERSLPLVKTFVRTNLDRSSLLSGLILFHLSFIRLSVPLEELHQIQYRLADNKEVDHGLVNTVRNWAESHQGRTGAERACNIWNIISKESDVERSKRVRFNLLAFIGLHHSAVLLWAYAAAQDSTNHSESHASPLTLRSNSPVPVDKCQTAKLLSSFVKLYDMISPAKWSSFAKATSMLSNRAFPDLRDQ